MNLQAIHHGLPRKDRQTDERLGRLREHLFAQLAGTAALDAVQFRVNPTNVPFDFCAHGYDFALTRPPRRW